MLKNTLILAFLVTGLLYIVNSRQNFYNLSNVHYVLVFLSVTLGLLLYRKHGDIPESSPLHKILDQPPKKGEDEIPCYNVPYKVIQTQYGDQGLLAGYNERVVAYEGPHAEYDDPTDTTLFEASQIQSKEEIVA